MNRRSFLGGALASCLMTAARAEQACSKLNLGVTLCEDDSGGVEPSPSPPDMQMFACNFDPTGGDMFDGGGGMPMCPMENALGDPYYESMNAIIARDGSRRDRWVLVSERGSRNAGAGVCRARDGSLAKIVMWDPHYLGELGRKAYNARLLLRGHERAAGLAVLFHEVGHHRNDDSLSQVHGEARRWQELYADYYAGREMARLGWSREASIAVFALMGSGGSTHPPAQERVQAAGMGWHNYHAQQYQSMQQFQHFFSR